jgi:hypothetical protein
VRFCLCIRQHAVDFTDDQARRIALIIDADDKLTLRLLPRGCGIDVLEHNISERLGVPETPEGIKNLDASQQALGIVISSDAFRQMFHGDSGLAKNHAQGIDIVIVGDLHGKIPSPNASKIARIDGYSHKLV